jgi:anti-anti-sigma factor
MNITKKINGNTCLIDIDGAIVGIHAVNLDQLIRSGEFIDMGIINLVLNLTKTSMIDSIGLDAIKHAQEQGLKVSILHPHGIVKEMLQRSKKIIAIFPYCGKGT